MGDENTGGASEPHPHILVLTGETAAGKTTTCRRLARYAAEKGLSPAGIVCPARFDRGQKVGIFATNLRSQETRLLATSISSPKPGNLGYQFDDSTLAWANSALAEALPCDLLIVDELGPLELEIGQGFTSAFDVLRKGGYRLAVVVVRPRLLGAFATRIGLPFTVHVIQGVSYEVAEADGGIPSCFHKYFPS